jgi:AraC-like DNA-binding protein
MHNLQCQPPCSALRALVRVYAQRELGPHDSDVIEAVPARLEQTLEFQFGYRFEVIHRDGHRLTAPEIVVVGAHPQGGTTIALKRGVVSFAVFFQPAGFSRLFGIPMVHLSRASHDARGVLGKSVSCLRDMLAETPTFEGRVRLTEHFLLKRAEKGTAEDPMTRAASDLFSARGAIRIADAAFRHGIGKRQFEREFLRHVGFTPKLYTRVARFQTALDAKIMYPQRRWVDIANQFGYHDQMHMIHDFRDLAGDAPGMILSMIGDCRPPALA